MALPLRRQILMLNAGILVPVFAVVAWAGWLTYREQLQQLHDETRTMAATVVAYLERSLETVDSLAGSLAVHPAVRTLDETSLGLVLQNVRSPLIENVFVARAGGEIAHWASPPDQAVREGASATWIRQVTDSRQRDVSPLLGAGGAQHSLLLAYPVQDGTRAVAVLGMQLRLEALETVLASLPLPPDSVVTLTDEQSTVIARSRDSLRFVGQSTEAPGQAHRLAEIPATQIRTGVDGLSRVFGNAQIARGPWLVSVGIPTSVANKRARPTYLRNIGLAAAVTLVTLLLEAFLVRRYLRAFRHVVTIADRVAAGDLTTPPQMPMPAREFDQIQLSFADMVGKLRQAQEAVAAQVADERRIRQEVQSLQRQVIRQERLAAIGVLVSGVAHELNNPLQAILGFAELLQLRGDVPASVRADLRLIQNESARASAIIRNLSRFGRQQTPEATPVRLRDVVASVVELRHRKLRERGIRLDVSEGSHATVLAVFTELQQVLLNFVINAEQAVISSCPQGTGRIIIRTVNRGDRAFLEVEDSGPGVPPEDEPRLFQPFFTTKPVGEGTGLGLSVSYGIIESHGGSIGYRRGEWGGAVFFFDLPIAMSDRATA